MANALRRITELDRLLSNRFGNRSRPDCLKAMQAAAQQAHTECHRLLEMVDSGYAEAFAE